MTDKTPGKKGLPPLAWAGIGCGGLLLVGVIGVSLLVGMCQRKFEQFADDMSDPATAAATVAETAIKLNPDLQLVKSDRDAGTITFREKKTGKETTVSYDDVAEGRLTVETEEGTTTIEGGEGGIRTETPDGVTTIGRGGAENLPNWFEVPAEVGKWQSIMRQESGGKVSGMMQGETTEEAPAVIDAFSKNLEAAGFVRQARTEVGPSVTVSYEKEGPPPRTINVTAIPQDGKIMVRLTYNQQ
ncbi:MAG: hypothetical protein HKN82_19820 [Akkermansiaceae bacterium]|nr:hypothetical protein [Akkermansiaceae bacterium]NNM29839.1 hypothetical protein [Akkermansiaceae bacterium]